MFPAQVSINLDASSADASSSDLHICRFCPQLRSHQWGKCPPTGQDAGGRLENTKDTLAMLHNSRSIAAVDGVVFASALLVNVASALAASSP